MGSLFSFADDTTKTLDKAYKELNLKLPKDTEFDNQNERNIFMAMNVARKKPEWLIPTIEALSLEWKIDQKLMEPLLAYLKQRQPLGELKYSGPAFEACDRRNEIVCT